MPDTFWGMPLWLGVIAAVLVIFARGQAYYWIGRVSGDRIYASRLGKRIGEERIQRVEGLVRRRGAVAVFGAHWVAVLRHAIPISAGAIHMSYPWFIGASALGSLLWTPPWVVGGYAIVWGWLQVAGRSPIAAIVIAVALAAGAWLYVARRRRARVLHDSPSQT